MKTALAVIFLCLTCLACDSGKDIPAMEVPSVSVNALKAQFPNATDMEWEVFGDNYQAEFEVASVDYHALIGAKGTLLKYKYEVNITDLPQEVIWTIQQNYPDEIADGAHVLKIENDTFYEVEFEGWITDKYKVFTSKGTENTNIEHWE